MKIIVGLGNIGDLYENTRHNCGFIVIDALKAQVNDTQKWELKEKLEAFICKFKYGKTEILLVKPVTLMNLSGRAVQKILKFFKEKPENLLVIVDDIDLPLGTIRMREKGSAGTHKGLKSIIQDIGTENFWRVRIGIENRSETMKKHQELSDFVLSKFKKDEKKTIENATDEAIAEIEKWLKRKSA